VLCLSGQSPHGHGGLGDSTHLVGEETEGNTPGLGHRDSRRAGYFCEGILYCLAPGTWWRAGSLAATAPEECLFTKGCLSVEWPFTDVLGDSGTTAQAWLPLPGHLEQIGSAQSQGAGGLSVSYTSSHEALQG